MITIWAMPHRFSKDHWWKVDCCSLDAVQTCPLRLKPEEIDDDDPQWSLLEFLEAGWRHGFVNHREMHYYLVCEVVQSATFLEVLVFCVADQEHQVHIFSWFKLNDFARWKRSVEAIGFSDLRVQKVIKICMYVSCSVIMFWYITPIRLVRNYNNHPEFETVFDILAVASLWDAFHKWYTCCIAALLGRSSQLVYLLYSGSLGRSSRLKYFSLMTSPLWCSMGKNFSCKHQYMMITPYKTKENKWISFRWSQFFSTLRT